MNRREAIAVMAASTVSLLPEPSLSNLVMRRDYMYTGNATYPVIKGYVVDDIPILCVGRFGHKVVTKAVLHEIAHSKNLRRQELGSALVPIVADNDEFTPVFGYVSKLQVSGDVLRATEFWHDDFVETMLHRPLRLVQTFKFKDGKQYLDTVFAEPWGATRIPTHAVSSPYGQVNHN